MISPEVVVLIGVGGTVVGIGGTVVGIIVGKYAIKSGQKEQLEDGVIANEKIRGHIKGIAASVAFNSIEIAAEKRKWLDERDALAIDKRFDTLEEKVDEVKHALDNGLAARIVEEVRASFGGEDASRLPIRKTRKNPATP